LKPSDECLQGGSPFLYPVGTWLPETRRDNFPSCKQVDGMDSNVQSAMRFFTNNKDTFLYPPKSQGNRGSDTLEFGSALAPNEAVAQKTLMQEYRLLAARGKEYLPPLSRSSSAMDRQTDGKAASQHASYFARCFLATARLYAGSKLLAVRGRWHSPLLDRRFERILRLSGW
jgi:hypothetical protein